MQRRFCKSIRAAAVVAAATLVLSACATITDGKPTAQVAPNANLAVVGDSGNSFDTTTKNAFSDILAFWKVQYPGISNGKSLPPLKGGLYSVDGAEVVRTGSVTGPASKEGCLARDPKFIIDNAAFCRIDDSIVWDRNDKHLVGALVSKYGSLLIALVFAHEFGHALQQRLGIFGQDLALIKTESQADCAAGAFLAEIVNHRSAHFRTTPEEIDSTLNGYLQVRDKTPETSNDISHGNGFDRLSALDDGLLHGPKFCYSSSYFDRQFTERPYVTQRDYTSGGNETLAQVLDPTPTASDGSGGGGLQPDLNRFWKAAAKSINKDFQDVKIAKADHPKCGTSSASEFGYCPDDNTVYYGDQYANRAYYSLTERQIDPTTKDVKLIDNQPADFALGTLFAVGWGMAVRHQMFNRSTDDKAALLAASCYVGAYTKDINVAEGKPFLLSPPDMDEATSAMLNLVGDDKAFGSRGTTGLQRVDSFVKGYQGGLAVC